MQSTLKFTKCEYPNQKNCNKIKHIYASDLIFLVYLFIVCKEWRYQIVSTFC